MRGDAREDGVTADRHGARHEFRGPSSSDSERLTTSGSAACDSSKRMVWVRMGRDASVWLDRACLGGGAVEIELSLLCLPLFVSGCGRLLILLGPAFPTRL